MPINLKNPEVEALLKELAAKTGESLTEAAGWARDAFRRFGKGRHPAALNMGDCIVYATARHAVLPLLFKGDGFIHTDVERFPFV